MPQQERINSYVDLQAIEKETKIFIDNLNLVIAKMTEISKNAEAAGISMSKASPKELQTSLQQTNKLMNEAVNTEKQLTQATIQYEKAVEEAKQAKQAYNYELKKTVEAETAAQGSLKQLRAEYSLLAKQYDSLSRAERENISIGGQMKKQLSDISTELKKLEAETGRNQRNVGNYAEAMNVANMSLGQIRQTLRSMKNMDISAFSPEQAAMYNKNLAMLTDAQADYNARIKAAGDTTENMISAVQGVVAIAQVATGVFAAFGIENDKLEKAMVQLIGVSQGLATIHKLREAQTLKMAAATVKETYATTRDTIAQWANNNAKAAGTKIGAKFFAVIASNPMLALAAAVAAVTIGIIALANSFKKTQSEVDKLIASQSEAIGSASAMAVQLDVLSEEIRKNENNETARNKAIEKYNEIAKEANVKTLDYKNSIAELNGVMETNRKLIFARAFALSAQSMIEETSAKIAELMVNKVTAKSEEEAAYIDMAINGYKHKLEVLMDVDAGLNKQIGTWEKQLGITDKNTKSTNTNTKATRDLYVQMEKIGNLFTQTKIWQKNPLTDVFPDKIKYTSTYIDQLSQSFKGLNQLLEEGQITPEEWAKRWEKLSAETAQKTAENTEKMKESLMSVVSASQDALGAFVALMETRTDAEIDNIRRAEDADLESLQRRLDQGLITQTQYDAASRGIQEQADARAEELARRQAAREKALASFNVAVLTAQAIMKFLVEPGGTYGLILSALAGVTGALQLANINAQPLPTYAKGRDGGPAETAIVGERGREVIADGRGNFYLTPNAPTLVNLPAGADVIPNNKVSSFMSKQMIKSELPDAMIGGKLDRLNETIRQKEFVKLEITRQGMSLVAQQGANKQRYINQRLRR